MPRLYRLSRRDFEYLQKIRPKRVHGSYYSASAYSPDDALKGPKIGFVVTKKAVPKAAKRNSIERRSREIVRELMKTKKTSNILIFQCKKGIAEADFGDLRKDLSSLFEQVS